MSIRVVARAVARPETREQLRRALLAVIPPTRAEAGCVRYELAQNVAAADEFVMLEEWRSEADVQAHLQTEHVQELLAQIPQLLAGAPEIRVYRTCDQRVGRRK